MKSLTRAEEQVMQVLWKLETGFLADILEEMAPLQLQRTTIATVIKVLVDKKYIGIKTVGRNNQYFPLVSKTVYSKASVSNMVENYFDGSYSNILSFLMKEKKLSVKELEKALQEIKKLEKGK